jgi:alpha-glucosidase (family GH31 glycosyl hydrolase)
MIGNKPDTVVSMLYTLIGNPVMIPQWALGWN